MHNILRASPQGDNCIVEEKTSAWTRITSAERLDVALLFSGYLFIVLLWIYAVPGWVAYREHVVSPEDVAAHLPPEAKIQVDTVSTSKVCIPGLRGTGYFADC